MKILEFISVFLILSALSCNSNKSKKVEEFSLSKRDSSVYKYILHNLPAEYTDLKLLDRRVDSPITLPDIGFSGYRLSQNFSVLNPNGKAVKKFSNFLITHSDSIFNAVSNKDLKE